MTQDAPGSAGIEIDATVRERMARFLDALLAENERLNLTAIRTIDEAWPLHIADSLALLPLIDESGAGSIVDLGSGCGVPGIPLAIARGTARVTLVDATRKKVDALSRIAAALNLPNVATVWGRAEELAHQPEHREQYDMLAARAVARLPLLLEFSAGFVRPGGRLLLMKSVQSATQERQEARSVAKRCSLKFVDSRPYSLPAEHGERVTLIYEKCGTLDPRLPRPAGKASQRPLE